MTLHEFTKNELDNIHKAGGRNNPYCGEFDNIAIIKIAKFFDAPISLFIERL